MLRLLIVLSVFLFHSMKVIAEGNPSDSLPAVNNNDIERQLEAARSVIDKADSLRNDPVLTKSIIQERHLLDGVRADGLRGLIDSLTDNPDQRGQRDFIDRILSAAETDSHATTTNNFNPMNPLVLVSFSMPDTALLSALSEAKRLGAAVYVRGFLNDNINQTIDRLIELSQEFDYALSIDPTVFTRFAVEAVPTYILPIEPIMPCNDNGCDSPEHVRATGAAGLEYFLDLVKRTGEAAEKAAAINWLEKADDES